MLRPSRGEGWQRKHATVNYVFDYSPYRLFKYHELIMQAMAERGYRVGPVSGWTRSIEAEQMPAYDSLKWRSYQSSFTHERDTAYLQECLDRSQAKRNHHLKEENDAFCLSGLHLKRKQQKALSCVFRQLIR